MTNNPIYRQVRFPLYLTQRQLDLLREAGEAKRVSICECVREAIHYWLRKEGKDDGQFYSSGEVMEAWERNVLRKRKSG